MNSTTTANPSLRFLSETSIVVQIAIGLVCGIAVALLAPDVARSTALLGDIFIAALKAVAPVLVFVLVAAAARHRRNAFEAADYLMDHLKSAAWLWKRERRDDGWHWIEPREADREDLQRW